MNQKLDRVLLIFIKNPQLGKAKTRLAATIGDEAALAAYKKLLAYTRKTVSPLPVDKQLWYSQFISEQDEWDEGVFDKKVQHGEDLGARMAAAFKQAFDAGYKRAVIIGSDCAQLQQKHLEGAFEALQKNDVVIGPSQDGGYYLLGMARYIPELFEDKPWSTENVFLQTLKDCRALKLRCEVLEQLNDVDTEDDWEQVKHKFE